MSTIRCAGLAIVASLALAACGDDSTEPVGAPKNLDVITGDAQTGVVGRTLINPIEVRVTDTNDEGVAGIEVLFTVTTGGGDFSDATVVTDELGLAQARWTLGPTAGFQTAAANVDDPGVNTLLLGATALADRPAALTITSGDDQEGILGEAAELQVRVTDQFNNGVRDVTVNWAVTEGDASLSAASSTTSSSGFAVDTVTLGQTAGDIEITAAVSGLPPVTFEALAKAQITEPIGDEFSTSASAGLVPPDITRITAWPTQSVLIVEIEFWDNVVSDVVGGANVVVGFLDIDLDQNAGTGATPKTDIARPGSGSTGMGIERYVDFDTGGTGDFTIYDASAAVVATFTPQFDGNVLRMAIPLNNLNKDGIVSLAAVVATVAEPTDIAPNDGNISLGPPPPP